MSEKVLKVLVRGDSKAGKSALCKRFTDNEFNDAYEETDGLDTFVKHVEVDGTPVKLQIWDLPGNENSMGVTSSNYQGTHGFILAFDCSDPNFLEVVNRWKKTVDTFSQSNNPVYLLVCTKSDLAERTVSTEEAKAWAEENDMPYIETSAKDNVNVEEAFTTIARRVIESEKNKGKSNTDDDEEEEEEEAKPKQPLKPKAESSGCCAIC